MPDEALFVSVRIEPLLVGVEDAGRMLGVSAKTVRRMIAAGELPSVLVGPGKGRRLLVVADLRAWVAGLRREGGVSDRPDAAYAQVVDRGAAAMADSDRRCSEGGAP